jgi:hypothetical protein
LGSGFNLFTNGIDVTPTTTGSWVDVDVSSYVPSGSTGAILKIVNTTSSAYRAEVRKNGGTQDIGLMIAASYYRVAFVMLDADRIFEAYIGNTGVKIYLIGYCDGNVGFLADLVEVNVTADDSWRDFDASSYIPEGSTGVICLLYNGATSAYFGGIRNNGSTNTFTRGNIAASYRYVYQLCGVDQNRVFEALRSNAGIHIMLVGYTKSPVTFFTNGIDVSLTTTNAWTDVDVTGNTSADADGAILCMVNTSSSVNPYGDVRKNGSSDDHTAYGRFAYNEARGVVVGLDSEQIFEGWIDNTVLDFYLLGYAKPVVVTVVVSNESLDKTRGISGETITYTATIQDEMGNALPSGFKVTLKIDGTILIEDQSLTSDVYNPTTKTLTLQWKVPVMSTIHTVKLAWTEQTVDSTLYGSGESTGVQFEIITVPPAITAEQFNIISITLIVCMNVIAIDTIMDVLEEARRKK